MKTKLAVLVWTLLVTTVAAAAELTSSTMQIQYDAQGHEMFVYTCVYADGTVLQNMPSCPPSD